MNRAMARPLSAGELVAFRQEILARRDSFEPCVTVCSGTGCQAGGAAPVAAAFAEELSKRGLAERVRVRRTGCHGFCEKGPIVVIFPEVCGGCRTCNPLCPFGAISYVEEAKVSRVNEAQCKGCGVCAAACPSGAITARHFSMGQLLAEIEGALA